jgi:quercetin dioxygenase-like cupin family protein
MPFFNAEQGTVRTLFPGVTIRAVWGEQIMMSFVEFEPHAVVPPHSHPHEQMGLLLEGEFEFTIGDETKMLTVGDVWFVPSNVVHSVQATEKGAKALDVFHPVREEYK